MEFKRQSANYWNEIWIALITINNLASTYKYLVKVGMMQSVYIMQKFLFFVQFFMMFFELS